MSLPPQIESGRTLEKAVVTLYPPAFSNEPQITPSSCTLTQLRNTSNQYE